MIASGNREYFVERRPDSISTSPGSNYAAPIARRCWKHSRQKTGRPCVGRKGTVVSFPHCEQLVLVSERIGLLLPPEASARLALQALHRFGSFLKPLSAKNICSPAVNTNSAPHSEHFRTLSWYSMEAFPLRPQFRKGNAQNSARKVGFHRNRGIQGTGLGLLGPASWYLQLPNCRSLPDRGLNHGSGRRALGEQVTAVSGQIATSILFAPLLLAQTLPRKRFLGPALFAGFHVETMLLDFLDDVFLLHLALETPQGIFQ
jgi:hypothetical protein